MPQASAVIARLNKVLNKVGPQARIAKKRLVSTTGGNSLIGKKGTVTYTDTLLNPQPYFNRMGRERTPGGHANWYEYVDKDGRQMVADDYEFIFSPTSITREEIEDPNVLIILTDADGNTETFRPTDVIAPGMNGTEMAFIVYMRLVGEVAA